METDKDLVNRWILPKPINEDDITNINLNHTLQTVLIRRGIDLNNEFDEYIGGWTELNKILCMEFNFKKLYEITRVITRNLNRVIDVNFYPVEEARNSNMKHRPVGIGVQGLADVFQMFKFPFPK